MKTTIQVEIETRNELSMLKIKKGLKSIEEVILHLLNQTTKEEQKCHNTSIK